MYFQGDFHFQIIQPATLHIKVGFKLACYLYLWMVKVKNNNYGQISSGDIIQFGDSQDIILFYYILFYFISFFLYPQLLLQLQLS